VFGDRAATTRRSGRARAATTRRRL